MSQPTPSATKATGDVALSTPPITQDPASPIQLPSSIETSTPPPFPRSLTSPTASTSPATERKCFPRFKNLGQCPDFAKLYAIRDLLTAQKKEAGEEAPASELEIAEEKELLKELLQREALEETQDDAPGNKWTQTKPKFSKEEVLGNINCYFFCWLANVERTKNWVEIFKSKTTLPPRKDGMTLNTKKTCIAFWQHPDVWSSELREEEAVVILSAVAVFSDINDQVIEETTHVEAPYHYRRYEPPTSSPETEAPRSSYSPYYDPTRNWSEQRDEAWFDFKESFRGGWTRFLDFEFTSPTAWRNLFKDEDD